MPTSTAITTVKGRFCAAVEQLAMGVLALSANEVETPRERALRVASDWLTGLPEADALPEELARSVAGTLSWLTYLREPDCSERDVGVFVCSVHQTSVLAVQYEAGERLIALGLCRKAPAEGLVH